MGSIQGLLKRLDIFFSLVVCLYRPELCDGPSNGFNITLLNVGEITEFDAVFSKVAKRWERIVTNDLLDVEPREDLFAGFFGEDRASLQHVDDLVIGYEFVDLPGSTLGRAGPTRVRTDGTSYAGVMQFDVHAFREYPESDVEIIILHEMGHVLGVGTLWNQAGCDSDCRENGGFVYTCAAAAQEYHALGLAARLRSGASTILTVADDGNIGSRCAHWEDDSFPDASWSELMTPFFDATKVQLLTTVTIASLTDIGDYQVDLSQADPIPTDDDDLLVNIIGLRTSANIDLRNGFDEIFPTRESLEP